MGEAVQVWGKGVNGKSLYFRLCCERKPALKIYVLKKVCVWEIKVRGYGRIFGKLVQLQWGQG